MNVRSRAGVTPTISKASRLSIAPFRIALGERWEYFLRKYVLLSANICHVCVSRTKSLTAGLLHRTKSSKGRAFAKLLA